MGEAKRRQREQANQLEGFLKVVPSVGETLRKISLAASDNFGADCFLHAELGRELLKDLGFECRRVVGYAAWRVGKGDGDVISHTKMAQGFLPPNAEGFAYHAWLEYLGQIVVDFTTYQLAHKAASLDAMDGGTTAVEWCPDMLVIPKKDLHSYRDVAQKNAGMAHYEEVPGLALTLEENFKLDAEDLRIAQLIMANPGVEVLGPCTDRIRG